MKTWLGIKFGLTGFAMLIILMRLKMHDIASHNMDTTILVLFVVAVLILVLPWERLKYFKAGGVELQLEQPQVQGALYGMLDAQPKKLRRLLASLGSKIAEAQGGRILWIDDNPHVVVGERRLLRALGIEVISATPETIKKRIEEDNDFDLIISDIQWRDKQGNATYGGMEQIKELREKHDDLVIRDLPVIFYTAYKPEQVENISKDVMIVRFQNIEFCYSIESLVQKSITTIAESRSNPIKVGKKQPT